MHEKQGGPTTGWRGNDALVVSVRETIDVRLPSPAKIHTQMFVGNFAWPVGHKVVWHSHWGLGEASKCFTH